MNYAKHYILLMKKARKRKLDGLKELHHVFPVSIYGKNNYIVALTPREHYVAHVLLYRALKHRYGVKDKRVIKMLGAVILLGSANFNGEKRKINSRLYQEIKQEYRILQSIRGKGENNPNFGKKHSIEARKKISDGLTGKKHSAEVRKRMGDGKRGKFWFYKEGLSVKSETCPDGFLPGRPPSVGHRISAAKKGIPISESLRLKLRAKMTGENNPQYGKKGVESAAYGRKQSDESKQKISQALTGRKVSVETRRKISEAKRGEKSPCWGKNWFTDGEVEVLTFERPEGFRSGRLCRKKSFNS